MPLVRVREEVMEELREYAESRGVTLGTAIGLLLEENRDGRVLVEILKTLCRIEEILKDLANSRLLYTESTVSIEAVEAEIPSFARDNPWIRVLRGRRNVREKG